MARGLPADAAIARAIKAVATLVPGLDDTGAGRSMAELMENLARASIALPASDRAGH